MDVRAVLFTVASEKDSEDEVNSVHDVFEVLDEGETETDRYLVSFVETEGGEGQGNAIWWVYQINDKQTGDEAYAELSAAWVSWDGIYWDDAEITRVYPHEVKKIVWRRKP